MDAAFYLPFTKIEKAGAETKENGVFTSDVPIRILSSTKIVNYRETVYIYLIFIMGNGIGPFGFLEKSRIVARHDEDSLRSVTLWAGRARCARLPGCVCQRRP